MVEFLSINFFLGFLQFLLDSSKVPVFLCHSVHLYREYTQWVNYFRILRKNIFWVWRYFTDIKRILNCDIIRIDKLTLIWIETSHENATNKQTHMCTRKINGTPEKLSFLNYESSRSTETYSELLTRFLMHITLRHLHLTVFTYFALSISFHSYLKGVVSGI